MDSAGKIILDEHLKLVNELTSRVMAFIEDNPAVEDPGTDTEALSRFLHERLLPHAKAENEHFYPAIEPLLKTYGRATSTMEIDHEFIESLARKIEKATAKMKDSGGPPGADNTQARAELHHLLLQLLTIVQVHIAKENRVYLPLFEKYLDDGEQQKILVKMESGESTPAETGDGHLDIRDIPPSQRLPMIMKAFEELSSGEGFLLINDHDPRPLYYMFKSELEGQFTWEYIEQGPQVWKVKIGKS